jgi:ribosomal protein S4
MARYTGNRNRIARRFGINIFGRARNPLLHKPNPPGVHGARRKKKSDFGFRELRSLKTLAKGPEGPLDSHPFFYK